MLLNGKSSLIDVLIEGGILSVLGDLIVDASDMHTLVYFFSILFISPLFVISESASRCSAIILVSSSFRIA